jgi:hypothetical protein
MMSDEKSKKLYGVEVNVDEMPESLRMFFRLALRVVDIGSVKDQEILGDTLMGAIAGAQAHVKYFDICPNIPDAIDKRVFSLRKEADTLVEGAGHSVMMVALVSARRIETLEKKIEKLTEMLVKADEKK